MPAKSRRNRRNISQSQRPVSNQPVSSSAAAVQEETTRSDKTISSFSPSPKAISNPDVNYPYIFGEIKWISVVTAIIAIILVILYIFFR